MLKLNLESSLSASQKYHPLRWLSLTYHNNKITGLSSWWTFRVISSIPTTNKDVTNFWNKHTSIHNITCHICIELKFPTILHIIVPVHSAIHSIPQYCRKTYIFSLTFNIWFVPFINMSFKNVCLLDFSAAKNAISHHTFHIQYNYMEKRKPPPPKKKLSLFKYVHKIERATTSSVMSVCLPVCLSTRNNSVPTGWILWNFMYKYFSNICWENSFFIKIWQEQQVLYVKPNVHLWQYLTQFWLKWEMFQI